MNPAPLPVVKLPEKILRAKARDILVADIMKPRVQELLTRMKVTLKQTPDGVGLAAPQVGESLRIFIVSDETEEIDRVEREREKDKALRQKPDEDPDKKSYEVREWHYYVFINPVVKNISRKKIDGAEGCLSVPKKFGIVPRHEKITVSAYDEHGKKFTRGASRFFARVLQHELDHLNGTLFVDKVSEWLDIENRHQIKK